MIDYVYRTPPELRHAPGLLSAGDVMKEYLEISGVPWYYRPPGVPKPEVRDFEPEAKLASFAVAAQYDIRGKHVSPEALRLSDLKRDLQRLRDADPAWGEYLDRAHGMIVEGRLFAEPLIYLLGTGESRTPIDRAPAEWKLGFPRFDGDLNHILDYDAGWVIFFRILVNRIDHHQLTPGHPALQWVLDVFSSKRP